MIASQIKGLDLDQNNQETTRKQHIFDTQISQQIQEHLEDKGFSPWIKQKTIIHHQYTPQQIVYHRFLAKIRLSPKHRGKFTKNVNPENNNLDLIKANLNCQIKVQKIGNSECLNDRIKVNSVNNKNLFERRSNLAKIYRRPKSIDLSLDFQPQNVLRCSPFYKLNQFNSDQLNSPNNKKQLRTIHKLRKKKHQTEQEKKSSIRLNDFHMNIFSAQKKVYQTLEMHLNQSSLKLKKPQTVADSSHLKNLSSFNRPKNSKPKLSKQTIQLTDNLACLGKSTLTNFGYRTCRQKIRSQHRAFKKQQINQIFMV